VAIQTYQQGIKHLLDNGLDNTVVRALLVDSTSTYAPNPDDDNIGTGITGLVEIAGGTANYARKTVTVTSVIDDTNNRVYLDCADQTWTAIGASGGPTAKGILLYIRVGADDTTPNDDVPLFYDDDMADYVLQGQDHTVTINAGGLIRVQI